MKNNNNNFKTVLSAALVAAAVSAAGIGLFAANQSRTPEQKEQVEAPPVVAPKPETLRHRPRRHSPIRRENRSRQWSATI